ncbi:MAG: ATP-dependent helicase RecG [Acidobacteriota bacterium]|jgi:ATP-dependent DNA helicase RecG|nr:ATP-dependent helicase RecG [Acidobacteriota bacterium]
MVLTDEELEALLATGESDRVELKPSLAEKKKIARAICAFANDLPASGKPGVVFVGLRDDGTPNGLAIDDALLRGLSELRTNANILPFPSLLVEKRRLRGADVAVVTAEPHDAPPVRLSGRIWISIGPTRREATASEEARLAERRRAKELPFDLRAVDAASIDDLDLDLFLRTYLRAAVDPEVIEANNRTLEQQLRSLRLLARSGDRPTILGCLVLAKDPTLYVPGAYVQFVRYAGTSVTSAIRDEERIDGPLSDVLRRLDGKIEAHLTSSVDFTSGTVERRQADYPIAALQQVTRNAILHRTYEATNSPIRVTWFEDRIEVFSPGGPFGQVTVENFGEAGLTDYRNPFLAEVLRNLGYVQRFGAGIPTIREQLARNGNPPPRFEPRPTHVLVTLEKAP